MGSGYCSLRYSSSIANVLSQSNKISTTQPLLERMDFGGQENAVFPLAVLLVVGQVMCINVHASGHPERSARHGGQAASPGMTLYLFPANSLLGQHTSMTDVNEDRGPGGPIGRKWRYGSQ